MNCLFCRIIKKEIPSYIIYEDNTVLVFLDINPDSNGHILIIPKKHYLDINDIDIKVLYHINVIAKKMYTLLKKKLNNEGLTITQNNGFVQEVKHYHLHLIPKYKDINKLTLEEVYKKLTS